jgi:lipoprotein-anchoring transpeptidase ErfK/SrfK
MNRNSTFCWTCALYLALFAPTVIAAQGPTEIIVGGVEVARPPREVQVMVSLQERRLRVMSGADTLRVASIAVASGDVLEYAGRRWRFDPPRGRLTVLAKRADPVWLPPDWHYVEVARSYGWRVRQLPRTGFTLGDGRRLEIRDSVVGLVMTSDTAFLELPVDEHVVFDSTLFIPPLATRNRTITHELGRFALDLGNGYLLHGTNDPSSIGTATTHGCIRLADDDLEWLYEHVPLGASVIIQD